MELAIGLAAVAVGAGLLRGGSLEKLAGTHFRAGPFLFAGLAVQVLFAAWTPNWLEGGAALVVVLASNALVGAFIVANRRLPGVVIAGVGLLLNLLVITANGAMPVSRAAMEAAGAEDAAAAPIDLKHEVAGRDTLVPWLGDVIPVPGPGFILSIGDVLLAVGIAVVAYRATTAEARVRPPR